MKRWCLLLFILTLLVMALPLTGQDLSSYKRLIFHSSNGSLPYRLLVPPGDSGRVYPLLIFLHGAYEKGTDNDLQLQIGGRFFLRDSIRQHYPAYMLFPQCPADDSWAYFENQVDFTTGYAKDWNFPFRSDPTQVASLLMQLVHTLLEEGKIDPERVYIAGLSQGGMGVLDLIARYPGVFAGAVSMCGAGNPATTRLIAGKTALWLFHGEKDSIVPPVYTQQFYRRLHRAGANVRLTTYPDTGHACWIPAFEKPEWVRWLFLQHKPG